MKDIYDIYGRLYDIHDIRQRFISHWGFINRVFID